MIGKDNSKFDWHTRRDSRIRFEVDRWPCSCTCDYREKLQPLPATLRRRTSANSLAGSGEYRRSRSRQKCRCERGCIVNVCI